MALRDAFSLSCKLSDRVNCKKATAVRKIDFEFKSDLGASETLSTTSSTAMTPSGVTIDSVTLSGTKAKMALSGGAAPKSYAGTATDDKLTSATHGLTDGETVQVIQDGGTLPAGLVTDRTYYVVSGTANDLKLAKTSGGTAIDITADGTCKIGLVHLVEVKIVTSASQTVWGAGLIQMSN